MSNIKMRKPYKLSELISIVVNAIIENNLSDEDINFCIYSRKTEDFASLKLVYYVDGYPYINDKDEEVYSDFVIKEKLDFFCSGENFEAVIRSVLYQKKHSNMDDFITGLNYYFNNDSFLTF